MRNRIKSISCLEIPILSWNRKSFSSQNYNPIIDFADNNDVVELFQTDGFDGFKLIAGRFFRLGRVPFTKCFKNSKRYPAVTNDGEGLGSPIFLGSVGPQPNLASSRRQSGVTVNLIQAPRINKERQGK